MPLLKVVLSEQSSIESNNSTTQPELESPTAANVSSDAIDAVKVFESPTEAEVTSDDELSRVPVDAVKHILKFCGMKDIASFSQASSQCLSLRNNYRVDMVRDTASRADDGRFHIFPISSTLRDSLAKDLSEMTIHRHGEDQFMLVPDRSSNAHWAMFTNKRERSTNPTVNNLLAQTKGYWKVLYPHVKHNATKFASVSDLNRILSLVRHPAIASELLNYNSPKNPFKQSQDSVHVHIHDREADEVREYEVLFWNGSDIGQVSAFKITKCSTGKTHYYMHGAWSKQSNHVQWLWYDNNSAEYMEYKFEEEVDDQIECAFQANLLHNYPVREVGDYLSCVTMNRLKEAYVAQYGEAHESKHFLFRFGFHGKDEEREGHIRSVEQLTITNYSFPRNVLRINLRNNTNDFCHDGKHFNLRMDPRDI